MNIDYGFVEIKSTGSQNMNYNATFSIGSPVLFIPLTFRVGFFYNQYYYTDNATTDMAIVKLPTALVGIGLWNLMLFERLKIDCSFDYYLASFLTEQLDASFGSELSLSYKIMQFNNFSVCRK